MPTSNPAGRKAHVFENLASDTKSGASALTARAARELSQVAASFADSDPGTFWDELVAACRALLEAQREMAPMVNLVGAVLTAAERVVLSGRPADTALNAVQLECARISESSEDMLREVGKHGSQLIERGAKIATTSDGGTVRAVIEAAAESGRTPVVLLSESRPGLEGVGLAGHLAGMGVETTLVVDAALPGLASTCDLVLLGADSVSEDTFVNKIGSYALALAAREADVPCYVAATTAKLLPSALRGDPTRRRDATEILEAPPSGLTPSNVYLEEVPNALIRALVTEEGPRDPDSIPEMLKERPVSPALLQLLYAAGKTERDQC